MRVKNTVIAISFSLLRKMYDFHLDIPFLFSGIGYEVALDMAFRNAHVILACRNKERGDVAVEKIKEETGNKNVELMLLDLASLASVRKFADEFKKRHKKLDILINNAGLTCKIEDCGPLKSNLARSYICLLYTSPSPRD